MPTRVALWCSAAQVEALCHSRFHDHRNSARLSAQLRSVLCNAGSAGPDVHLESSNHVRGYERAGHLTHGTQPAEGMTVVQYTTCTLAAHTVLAPLSAKLWGQWHRGAGAADAAALETLHCPTSMVTTLQLKCVVRGTGGMSLSSTTPSVSSSQSRQTQVVCRHTARLLPLLTCSLSTLAGSSHPLSPCLLLSSPSQRTCQT